MKVKFVLNGEVCIGTLCRDNLYRVIYGNHVYDTVAYGEGTDDNYLLEQYDRGRIVTTLIR